MVNLTLSTILLCNLENLQCLTIDFGHVDPKIACKYVY